jgi:hypothetical protein
MRIRPIDIETEYETLKAWWEARGLAAPSKVILQGATGFAVAHQEGHVDRDLVAGWIYVSNKGVIGFVEWVTSNPGTEGVRAALTMLYDFLEIFAKDAGCVALFTTTPKGGSIRRLLEGEGWRYCPGEPHVHLLKELP